MKNKMMYSAVLLVLTFMAGFLPGYVKGGRQEKELRETKQENRLLEIRDLAGLAYLQANQKDYGLAAGTTSRLFDRVSEAANQTLNSSDRKSLESLLTFRDTVTSGLAKGDPTVLSDLQALLIRTRQATIATVNAPQP